MKENIIVWYYCGQIEIAKTCKTNKKLKIRWVNGYARKTPAGQIEYPWLSKNQCLAQAKLENKKSHFIMH